MDNFYFIGYRIDCNTEGSTLKDSIGLSKRINEAAEAYSGNDGLAKTDFLPGSRWMTWSHPAGNPVVLALDFPSLPADYRCPIDRSELWENMHEEPFDLPEDYEDHFLKIKQSLIHAILRKLYGEDNISVTWGIFLGLG